MTMNSNTSQGELRNVWVISQAGFEIQPVRRYLHQPEHHAGQRAQRHGGD